MSAFPIGPQLSAETLARAAELPLKPAPVTLTGTHVQLVPLELERDTPALFARSNGEPVALGDRQVDGYDPGELVWRYLSGGPFASVADLAAWLRLQVEARDGRCFCVVDRATDGPIGVVNYMTNFPMHLKIELGNIWYSPLVQRSKANVEATYLLLNHAFALGYRRVEWKCDALNERSRRAALRMGFTFEGIQEAHFIVKGRNRDTAWFRILEHEWPAVRNRLARLIAE